MQREPTSDLHELLTNRRHARHATDLRALTSHDHWAREISELRQQQREGVIARPRGAPRADD